LQHRNGEAGELDLYWIVETKVSPQPFSILDRGLDSGHLANWIAYKPKERKGKKGDS
jgi:hypothetical protein